jgi:hypothetical protein
MAAHRGASGRCAAGAMALLELARSGAGAEEASRV